MSVKEIRDKEMLQALNGVAGVDPHARDAREDGEGETAMHICTGNGNIDAMQDLLDVFYA